MKIYRYKHKDKIYYGVLKEENLYQIEGSVRNVGTVPLDDIRIEVSCYDSDGALVMTESAPLEPGLVAVSGSAHFRVELQQAKKLKTYTYKFVTASGESIPFKRGD